MMNTNEFIYTLSQMLNLDLENKIQTKDNQIIISTPDNKNLIISAKKGDANEN